MSPNNKKIIYKPLNLNLEMMQTPKFTFIALTVMILMACNSHKKTTTTSAPAATNNPPATNYTMKYSKPSYDIVPGDAELAAIKVDFADVSMTKLKEGYEIYAQGACVGCHKAKNIYPKSVSDWKVIIDDMAPRAQITEEQKDAVYKYVLSIKATQPK